MTDSISKSDSGIAAVARFCASSFTAGACIGIAAMAYLRLGGLQGSVLFAIGLMAVVYFDLKLFTGKSQFVWGRRRREDPNSLGYDSLLLMLIFNIVGCAVMSFLNSGAPLAVDPSGIVERRLIDGPLLCGIKAIPCGFIMTLSVRSAKGGNWWPLIFGVPTFIVCGFPHCIADVFYYASSPWLLLMAPLDCLFVYLPCVLGNYIGCNFYRSFTQQTEKK